MPRSLARCAWVAVFLGAVRAAGQAAATEDDAQFLLHGVTQIAAPGVPGPLCVFGGQAFPVATGAHGGARDPVVAAARMGKGRVVVFGHTGYLDGPTMGVGDTGRLMANAVRWAAGANAATARVAVRGHGGLCAFLQKQGFKAEALDGPDWPQKLSAFSVLCMNPNSLSADADYAAVTDFVKAGGGLIAADLGWGWLQLHPGKTLLKDHPGNRLLAPAGIVWADGYLGRTAEAGFDAKTPPPALCHAGRALDALIAHSEGKTQLQKDDAAQAAWAVSSAARAIPPDDELLLPRLRRLQQTSAAQAVPTPDKPLRMDHPLARVLLTLQIEEIKRLPPEQVRPHPAAAAFPGAVPADAKRVTRTVQVDSRIPAWHSTGLYAAPGELVTVTVPEPAVGKGLLVRIGAHSDSLWNHATWHRAPEICRQFPIAKPVTEAANAFGGPVYVEVPGGCKLGTVAVEIRGAVEAPYYVAGETSLKDWRESIRQRPAPWAELATRKVILTLPSKAVRKLEDPEDLMKFWDRVLDACADLATIPLDRPCPQRYVTDIQIGAGYMHSGYPIMTLLDMPDVMVDKARMMADAHGGVWGLFHEMGHNHQSGDWTFDGAGEVTVNLFTLHVFDKVCGRPKSASGRVRGPGAAKALRAYIAGGADFKKWKGDPFLALQMYVQLVDAFGWDAFKKVFAEYRALPASERPRNDDAKRDQWMVRFSRAVGRSLGPFFQAWGVPTSEKARASIAHLPAWLPAGFPPK